MRSRLYPFRSPATQAHTRHEPHQRGEKTMKDFARVSVGIQAVKLNWVVARVRQFCYFLAQKGNPEIKA